MSRDDMSIDTRHSLSRRDALVRLGAGGVAAGLALRSVAAGAQEATPLGTPGAVPPALAEWVAGWEGADPDRIMAAYAPDAAREEAPVGVIQRGQEAIRARFVDTFGAFSGAVAQVTAAFAGDAGGVAEWVFGGTYTGQIPGFPSGAGQAITLRGASVFVLAGGEIVRETVYFDAYGLLVQLRVVPPLGTPSTGTPTA